MWGATVNGLEAGQTFLIACAVAFHNLWELAGYAGTQPAARSVAEASAPLACMHPRVSHQGNNHCALCLPLGLSLMEGKFA